MEFLNHGSRNHGEVHNSGMPSRRWNQRDIRFRETGGSQEMNVDGTTPKDFIAAPATGEIWIVDYLTLALIDPGDMEPATWGSKVATPLALGLLLFSTLNTVEREMTNLKDNLDILQCFAGALPGALAVGAVDPGFLNTVDYVSGCMHYPPGKELILIGDDSDNIGFRVRDNLLDTLHLRASVHYRIDIEL